MYAQKESILPKSITGQMENTLHDSPASREAGRVAAAAMIGSPSSASPRRSPYMPDSKVEFGASPPEEERITTVERNIQRLQESHDTENSHNKKDDNAKLSAEDRCCDDACDDDELSGVLDDVTAVGNGCGEAVSPPSSCADTFLLGPSLAAAAKPTEWSLQSFQPTTTTPAAAAATAAAATSTAHATAIPRPDTLTVAGEESRAKGTAKPASFTAQAMHAIVKSASNAPVNRNTAAHPHNTSTTTTTTTITTTTSNNNSAVGTTQTRVIGGDDPMGVRQLYSLPHSLAGSCVSVTSANRRATGPSHHAHLNNAAAEAKSSTTSSAAAAAAAAAEMHSTVPVTATSSSSPLQLASDAFSMERFATFYEVALEELVSECERRVANAPAAWRDGQRRFLRGDSNYDLATSTLSFDSPRSSGISPVTGHAPQFSVPAAYPPCFPNASHNTHGLHTRELSSSSSAMNTGNNNSTTNVGSSRGMTLPPPPALQPRSFFFSAAGQARQAELEREAAGAEETVPALLAALGRHHGKMAPMVFIAALAYLARVTVQCASEFLSITRANWYRLTTTAILVAAKVYDEHSSTRLNAHFARSAGIPLGEMTKLELDFLYLIDFDLLLKEAEVEEWLTWMETLAVRRDLMTPLQSYFVQSAESSSSTTSSAASPITSAAATAAAAESGCAKPSCFSPASTSLCSANLTETAEKSRTVGFSAEGGPVTDSTAVTSPLSAPVSRTFTHVRVASNTVFFAKDGAPARRLTGAADAAAPAANNSTATSSAAIPLYDLHSPSVRSPASSLVMPRSLLEAPRSTLSGISLPGSVSAPVASLRAAGVPPSPIHGVLPRCPPPQQTRLFSVVHGRREPPSPRSVRQLSRLGASPPSPLQPPPMEPNSPVGFFKQPAGAGHGFYAHHAHGPHRHGAASTGSAAAVAATATGHGLCDAEHTSAAATAAAIATGFSHAASSQQSNQRREATAGRRGAAAYTSHSSVTSAHAGTVVADATNVAAAAHPSASSVGAAGCTGGSNSSSGATRWGPFGMVQQVRDVLGVTASLVRGQLNVLAPAKVSETQRSTATTTSSAYRSNNNTNNNISSSASSAGRRSAPADAVSMQLPIQQQQQQQSSNSPGRYTRRYHPASPDQLGAGDKPRSPALRRYVNPSTPQQQQQRPQQRHDDPRGHAKAAGQSPYRGAGQRGMSGAAAAASVSAGAAVDENDVYDEEEGEYYEEEEEEDAYGYYGEDGYYYYYEDAEGEEGEYYYEEEEGEEGWYEEEEEAEADYFQRCRPPLTHSPPSL